MRPTLANRRRQHELVVPTASSVESRSYPFVACRVPSTAVTGWRSPRDPRAVVEGRGLLSIGVLDAPGQTPDLRVGHSRRSPAKGPVTSGSGRRPPSGWRPPSERRPPSRWWPGSPMAIRRSSRGPSYLLAGCGALQFGRSGQRVEGRIRCLRDSQRDVTRPARGEGVHRKAVLRRIIRGSRQGRGSKPPVAAASPNRFLWLPALDACQHRTPFIGHPAVQ